MNAPAWAAVAVASLTLAWGITAWMLARSLKSERERGTISAQLANVVRDLDRIAAGDDKVHAEMLSQMRDDRRATDTRLRWLETHIWSVQRRDRGGGH